MTVLSDGEMQEEFLRWKVGGDVDQHGHVVGISIAGMQSENVQPASVDLRLGAEFRVFENHGETAIDPADRSQQLTRLVTIPQTGGGWRGPDAVPFILHPGEFVLASTIEVVSMPSYLVARVEGKSSLGRLGLQIHSTAGFIDPGFTGTVTLELSNVARLPIKLYPGMDICQISFMRMGRPAERPYGHPTRNSKYQGQQGPSASLYAHNGGR